MKLFGIVIRRSFVSEKEPKWFHDCHRNNGFQIGFFGWVIYYNKGKEEKHREQEAGRKIRQARHKQFIEFVIILALAILVVALALSALYR